MDNPQYEFQFYRHEALIVGGVSNNGTCRRFLGATICRLCKGNNENEMTKSLLLETTQSFFIFFSLFFDDKTTGASGRFLGIMLGA